MKVGQKKKQKYNDILYNIQNFEANNQFVEQQRTGYKEIKGYVTRKLEHDQTRCLKCGMICHDSCSVGDNKENCASMESNDKGEKVCKYCHHFAKDHENLTEITTYEVIRREKIMETYQEQISQDEKRKQYSDLHNELQKLKNDLPNPFSLLNEQKPPNRDLTSEEIKAIYVREKKKARSLLQEKIIEASSLLTNQQKLKELGFDNDVEFLTMDEVHIKGDAEKLFSFLKGDVPKIMKPQQQDEFSKQLLVNYAQRGAVESIKEIIEDHNYDINYIPEKIGCAPIHAAAEYGDMDTLHYLLKKGADMSLLNKDNKKPYELAVNEQVRERLINEFNSRKKEERILQILSSSEDGLKSLQSNENYKKPLKIEELIHQGYEFNQIKGKLQQVAEQLFQEQFEQIKIKKLRNISNKMISDLQDYGLKGQKLKALRNKMLKLPKFDQVKQKSLISKLKTIEQAKDWEVQFNKSNFEMIQKKYEQMKKQVNDFQQQYFNQRNQTLMLKKHLPVIFDVSQDLQEVNLICKLLKNENYKIAKDQDQLFSIFKKASQSKLIVFYKQIITQSDFQDLLNNDFKQIQEIYLVGKNQTITISDNLLNKSSNCMKITKIENIYNNLDYILNNTQDFEFLGRIPSEIIKCYILDQKNLDLIENPKPLEKHQIEDFESLSQLLKYNKDITTKIKNHIEVREFNSQVQDYLNGSLPSWISALQNCNAQSWLIDNTYSGQITAYTQGPLSYFFNKGLNIGNEKIFNLLKRQILIFNYQLQNYKDNQEDFFQKKQKLYRGISINNIQEYMDLFEVNQIFYFPAFSSFSKDKKVAKEFSQNKLMFVLVINPNSNIPNHQRPKYVEKAAVEQYKYQKEFIFPYFSKFKVTKKKENKNKLSKIYLELLPKLSQ